MTPPKSSGCWDNLAGTQGVYQGENNEEAYRLFKLAADQGFALAQGRLSILEKDKKEAFRYLKLAADQGHAQAYVNLGHMYKDGFTKDGFSVEKNFIESLHWFIKSKVNNTIH